MPYKDKEKAREYSRNHKRTEKSRAKSKEYKEKNRDKIRKQQLEYRQRPEVQKRLKGYYGKNIGRKKENQKRYADKKKELIKSLKTECINCGESDLCCIDFHHMDPSTKSFTIGNGNRGYDSIIEETEKCVCLCSNCHRKLHAGRISL